MLATAIACFQLYQGLRNELKKLQPSDTPKGLLISSAVYRKRTNNIMSQRQPIEAGIASIAATHDLLALFPATENASVSTSAISILLRQA